MNSSVGWRKLLLYAHIKSGITSAAQYTKFSTVHRSELMLIDESLKNYSLRMLAIRLLRDVQLQVLFNSLSKCLSRLLPICF